MKLHQFWNAPRWPEFRADACPHWEGCRFTLGWTFEEQNRINFELYDRTPAPAVWKQPTARPTVDHKTFGTWTRNTDRDFQFVSSFAATSARTLLVVKMSRHCRILVFCFAVFVVVLVVRPVFDILKLNPAGTDSHVQFQIPSSSFQLKYVFLFTQLIWQTNVWRAFATELRWRILLPFFCRLRQVESTRKTQLNVQSLTRVFNSSTNWTPVMKLTVQSRNIFRQNVDAFRQRICCNKANSLL